MKWAIEMTLIGGGIIYFKNTSVDYNGYHLYSITKDIKEAKTWKTKLEAQSIADEFDGTRVIKIEKDKTND